jgi:peptide/nickel transport system ATP-binding protein
MTAMAMCPKPNLIVFDEPTTGLDVTTQVQVLAAIREVVHEANTAAIYISHDLAVVAQMADRIAILREGRIVEVGSTEEILRAPKHPYTRTLWSVRNLQVVERSPAPVVLTIRSLSASYGATHVLKDVSIDIPRGRTVAVVGESGSGKSTLARCITGLSRPTRGYIELGGRRLSSALASRSKTECRRIQMVHQSSDTSLNPRQSVREIVGRPLRHFFGLDSRQRERRILEYADQLALSPDLIDRCPPQLSGGQKQRVCLARALAAEPEIIICDEVTSALDQVVQEEILLLLQRIQEATGVSYLFITHDLAIVRAIADEVVVMHDGKVVEQGSRSEVFGPPYHPYTELLLSSVPDMDPGWLTRTLAGRPSGSDL